MSDILNTMTRSFKMFYLILVILVPTRFSILPTVVLSLLSTTVNSLCALVESHSKSKITTTPAKLMTCIRPMTSRMDESIK